MHFSVENYDVICFVEHWLRTDEIPSLSINDYQIADYYCRSLYKNGGVIVLYKDSKIVHMKPLVISHLCEERVLEASGAVFTLKNNFDVKIVSIYRSPIEANLDSFFEKFRYLLNYLCKNNGLLVISGDINIDLLLNSDAKIYFTNLLLAYNLKLVNTGPSRITQSSSTCIDFVCSNFSNGIDCITDFNGLSDHSAQIIHSKININDVSPEWYLARRYTSSGYRELNYYLSLQSWMEIYNTYTVEDGFQAFVTTLNFYIDLSFPVKKYWRSRSKPWLTQGILNSSKKLKHLYRDAIESRRDEDFEYYKLYKSIYRKVLSTAKRLYNVNLYKTATNKSKITWNIINNNTNSHLRRKEIKEIRVGNLNIDSPVHIAQAFNNFFVDSVTKHATNHSANTDNCKIQWNDRSMFLDNVSETEVLYAVLQLKSSNASGIDLITNNILKQNIQFLVQPLTALINRSFTDGIFPNCLKIAKVLPLYKKGDPNDLTSYRPVSLLSVISKVMEKIISERLTSFLSYAKILSTRQHGFIKKKSTETAMLEFINTLYNELNNGKKCIGVFMDLSKAFDLVDHKILLGKLNNYGIRGKTLDWLSSYLKGRSLTVEVQGQRLGSMVIDRGVPQGSVLGPLLFVIYVNDLLLTVGKSNTVMYADDTSFLIAEDSTESLLLSTQSLLNAFNGWFQNNRLYVNKEKTVFMRFSPGISNLKESSLLKVDSCSIRQVHNVKLLGVHLENSLNWETHVGNLGKQLASVCYAIYKLKRVTNLDIVLNYYYAHFQSKLRYGVLLWGASTHCNKIFRLQKLAIRNMFGLSRRTSCRSYFSTQRILTLTGLYVFEMALYVRSNINSFIKNTNFHKYNTRNKNDLCIPIHDLSTFERSPVYMGIKIYNYLPIVIKNVTSVGLFKTELLKFLQNNVFYNLNEFFSLAYT